MSSGLSSALQTKTAAWQGVLLIGLAGLVLAGLKAWWATPAQAPMSAVATPSPSTVALPMAASATPTSKLLSATTPASSFAPSRIAPADLPPGLAGLARPPREPEPYVEPIGVEPGFVPPSGPQLRDIR